MNTIPLDYTLNNNGVSPPPAKRARSNTTNGNDLLTNFNAHQDNQHDATDDLLSGFRAYLEEKAANPPNIDQLVANIQTQQERRPPRVVGVGVVYPLSTYFSDPANYANFKWLGRKYGDPDPPPSLIRQQTGYDFPIPSVSGILYPMAQAHEMMEKRRARATAMGMGMDYQFNGQMGVNNFDQSFGPGPVNNHNQFHDQGFNPNAGYLHPQMQAQTHGHVPPQMRYPGRTPPLQPSPMTPGTPHTGMGFPNSFSGRQVTPTPSQRRPSLMRQCATISPIQAPVEDLGQYQGPRPSLPNMTAAPSTNTMNGIGQYLPNEQTNPIPPPQTPANGPYQVHAGSPPGSTSSQYSTGNTPPARPGKDLPNLSTTPTGLIPNVNPFDNLETNTNPSMGMNNLESPSKETSNQLEANTEAALLAVGADVIDFAPAATNNNPVPSNADAATTSAPATTTATTTPPRSISGYDGANSGTDRHTKVTTNMNVTDTDEGHGLFNFNPFPFDGEGEDGIDLDGWSSDGLLFDEGRPFNAGDWGFDV